MKTGVFTITTELNDINHLATTLWFSGCKIRCGGCQNKELLEFSDGLSFETIEKELRERRKLTDWLVYLGGNPIDSIDSLIKISTLAKELGYKQFLYTGYEIEQIKEIVGEKTLKQLASLIDYMKVGKYDTNYSREKECGEIGRQYFFETVNQSVYKSDSQQGGWEPFYTFNKFKQELASDQLIIV